MIYNYYVPSIVVLLLVPSFAVSTVSIEERSKLFPELNLWSCDVEKGTFFGYQYHPDDDFEWVLPSNTLIPIFVSGTDRHTELEFVFRGKDIDERFEFQALTFENTRVDVESINTKTGLLRSPYGFHLNTSLFRKTFKALYLRIPVGSTWSIDSIVSNANWLPFNQEKRIYLALSLGIAPKLQLYSDHVYWKENAVEEIEMANQALDVKRQMKILGDYLITARIESFLHKKIEFNTPYDAQAPVMGPEKTDEYFNGLLTTRDTVEMEFDPNDMELPQRRYLELYDSSKAHPHFTLHATLERLSGDCHMARLFRLVSDRLTKLIDSEATDIRFDTRKFVHPYFRTIIFLYIPPECRMGIKSFKISS